MDVVKGQQVSCSSDCMFPSNLNKVILDLTVWKNPTDFSLSRVLVLVHGGTHVASDFAANDFKCSV